MKDPYEAVTGGGTVPDDQDYLNFGTGDVFNAYHQARQGICGKYITGTKKNGLIYI